jgi:hypothetical protein
MKTVAGIFTFLLSIASIYSFGQEKYIVTAENGLLMREDPDSNGKKIAKLNFGAEVTIVEKTENNQTIADDGKQIKGTWVKIEFKNFPMFVSNEEFGYVFDGYLKKKSEIRKEIAFEISKHSELKDYTINQSKTPFYLKGNFFGDSINDIAVVLKDSQGTTKVAIINYGQKTKVHLLGGENDPFNMTDYSWLGIFQKINRGEALWSNYEDDFIDYEDVPESKKVRLNYDALYMHASESCGGGFVYWKNGKFNWLQQE